VTAAPDFAAESISAGTTVAAIADLVKLTDHD
jgi:hypothetical protein